MGFRLRIEDGSYVQTLEVRAGALTVGRSPPNGVALSSPGLSARHAVFRQKGDRVELEAVATKIGVRLRGERVDQALLAPGETVDLGAAHITVVEISADAAAAESPAAGESAVPGEFAAPADPALAEPLAPLEFADEPSSPTPPRPVAVAPMRRAAQAGLRRTATLATDAAASARESRRHAPEPDADFVVLSKQAVRVLPWWGISVALHGLLFGAMLMLPRTEAGRDDASDSTFEVTLRRAPPRIEPEVPAIEPNRRVDVQRPDMAVAMDAPDSTLPASADPKGRGAAARADDHEFVLDDPAVGSPWAQPGGSSAIGVGAGARTGSGTASSLDESFGKGDAGRANAAAAGKLTGDPFTRALVNGLRLRTNAANVKVVKGDYDQGELSMEALGLRHGWITGDELSHSAPGQDVRAIFFNCTGRPVPRAALGNIERWVAEGGYFFSSDWGIEVVVEKAFPGYLKAMRDGPRTVMTPDETITFTIAPGRHALLAGLPPEAETARWWLEESSIPFVVEKPADVEVLVQSSDLDRKHGSKFVAVTFPYGKGRVVHVLGHMYQKEGNLRGAYAMQRLLLNFLYQAIRQ